MTHQQTINESTPSDNIPNSQKAAHARCNETVSAARCLRHAEDEAQKSRRRCSSSPKCFGKLGISPMTLALDTTVYVGCLSGLANRKASVPATTRAAAASMAITCRQEVFISSPTSFISYQLSQVPRKRDYPTISRREHFSIIRHLSSSFKPTHCMARPKPFRRLHRVSATNQARKAPSDGDLV